MNKKKDNIIILLLFTALVIFSIFTIVSFAGQAKNVGHISILDFVLIYIVLIVEFLLAVLFHELGHLIAGLISGYEFLYYRIGSYALVNYGDGFRIKRQYAPGTGGQCLLVPPKLVNGDYPWLFYNLGGILMNIILAIVCLVLLLQAKGPMEIAIYKLNIGINLYFALGNGINIQGTDGGNIVEMKNSKSARENFWDVLNYEAMSIRDTAGLDDYNFLTDDNKGVIGQYKQIIEIDKNVFDGNYEEVLALSDEFLNREDAHMLYKGEVAFNRAYARTILEKKENLLDELYADKQMKNYYKGTMNNPSRSRFNIMYYSIIKPDKVKLHESLEKFEKDIARELNLHYAGLERNEIKKYIS